MTHLLEDIEDEFPLYWHIYIYYPGQFLLSPNGPSYFWINDGGESYGYDITDLEYLKSRNSQKRTCTLENKIMSYDDMVYKEHLVRNDCRPPYFKPTKDYPICNTTQKLKSALYSYSTVRTKYFPWACKRISKLSLTETYDKLEADGTLNISISYPTFTRIITQSKEVDIHALIGNIGGYIGLILGNI